MTISTATSTASYTGNASTQIFPIPFYFLVDGDIKVSQKVAATGVISVLTLGTDYTLSGAGNQAGGSATLVTAPASGDQLFIERNVSAVQETAYPVNGPFPSASHEKALDRLTMLVQQLQTADEFTLTRDPLANFYDVGGNRLTNLADAQSPNDAVSLQQQTKAIAAAQLTPSVPSADIALLSNLASTAAGKGAALLGYLTGTVKSFLDNLATDAGATYIKYKAGFTGAIQRTLGQVASDEINSAWFGADNTGASNASTALQAALDAAAGKKLIIKPGTYSLTTALQVSSNTTVHAYGCTFIRNGATDNLLRNKANGTTGGNGANNGIFILGGKWDANFGQGFGNCTLLAFGHANNINVKDATLTNGTQWHHIELNAVAGALVENCIFIDGAAQSGNGTEAIQIDSADNTGQFPWFGPYDGAVCSNILIKGCTFTNCGTGIGTHSDPASAHTNIKIEANTLSGTQYAGVRIHGWSGTKILNNHFSHGVYGVIGDTVAGMQQNDTLIQGNTFTSIGAVSTYAISNGKVVWLNGLSAGTANFNDIRFIGNNVSNSKQTPMNAGCTFTYCSRVAIAGNTVKDTNGYGIVCYGGSYLLLTGNKVDSTTDSNFRVGGSGVANDVTHVTATGNIGNSFEISDSASAIVSLNRLTNSMTSTANNATTVKVVNNLVGSTWA